MELTTSSVTFLVATAAYLGIRGFFKRKLSTGNKAVNKSSTGDMALVSLVVAGQLIVPLLAIATPLLDWADYHSPTTALTWAGALLMTAGVWLFWRSHADLGENWSVTLELQQGHKLVSSGVYKLIRHPMYAAFFVMAAGQSLLLCNWIAGPSALLAVALLYVVRKPNEEAMLIEQFGEEYRRYMASTGGVIPRIGTTNA